MTCVTIKLLKKINDYSAKYNIIVDLQLISFAIEYIKKYHKHQKRHSGEPYYYHPAEVAIIVIDYFFDTATIIAAGQKQQYHNAAHQ